MSEQALTVQENDNLITIKQLPVIEQQLERLKPEIQAAVDKALSLPVTAETVKEIKKLRAALRSRFEALETERKRIKEALAAPYNKMMVTYGDCVSDPLKEGDAKLKERIDQVEDSIKKQMEDVIVAYFTEYALAKNVGFLSFADSGIKVLLSSTEKQLKEECRAFIDTVAFDIDTLGTLDNGVELVAEYKANGFDSMKAITTVNARHAAIEKEKARQAEREAAQKQQSAAEAKVNAVMSARVITGVDFGKGGDMTVIYEPDENEVLTVSFTVTATRKQIRVLREYMKGANIRYE
jgi:ribosomal protein L9